MIEAWERTRSPDLSALADAALPGESLSEDEIVACLFDDPEPTLVVGSPDGAAAAGAVVRDVGGRRTGFVQFVAVAPEARGRGLAATAVRALHEWALGDQGAASMVVGDRSGLSLWPGVDVHMTAALCLFESLGYEPIGATVNLSFPCGMRARPPAGIEVRRALDDADANAVLGLCAARAPEWVAAVARAVDHGSCLAAFAAPAGEGGDQGGDDPRSERVPDNPPYDDPRRDDPPAVAGFACHSVSRLGWLGPMAVEAGQRRRGIGSALLGAVATDAMAAGLSSVEVVAPAALRFFAKAAGASASRTFRTLRLARPHPA